MIHLFGNGLLDGTFYSCPKRGNYDEDYNDDAGDDYDPEEDLDMMYPDEDDRKELYE